MKLEKHFCRLLSRALVLVLISLSVNVPFAAFADGSVSSEESSRHCQKNNGDVGCAIFVSTGITYGGASGFMTSGATTAGYAAYLSVPSAAAGVAGASGVIALFAALGATVGGGVFSGILLSSVHEKVLAYHAQEALEYLGDTNSEHYALASFFSEWREQIEQRTPGASPSYSDADLARLLVLVHENSIAVVTQQGEF